MTAKHSVGEWVLIASGLLTITVVGVFDRNINPHWDLGRLLIFSAIVALYLYYSFTNRTPNGYRDKIIVLLLAALTFLLFSGFTWDPLFVLLVVWATLLPDTFPRHSWWVLLGVNALVISCDQLLAEQSLSILTVLMFVGFQMFAISSSQARKEARENKESLEHLNLELQATQALLAQRSQQQERMRIARDLHDSIGHRLTALSLQLEHAKHQPPSDVEPFRLKLADTVKDTLSELREIVRAMRADVAVDLSKVCRRLEQSLPEAISISYPETLFIDDPDLGAELAFCLQEGISNALRHGKASEITVALKSTQPLCISIDDNGRGANNWVVGNGLKGMRERLQSYGGSAELSPKGEGGMLLDFIIPGAHHA